MSYKRWILIAIFLFGIGLALGLAPLPSTPTIISEDIAAVEELAGLLASLPLPVVVLIIFIKNAVVLLISFLFSPILCLVPILILIVNGWVLSLVSVVVVQETSPWFLLAGILPHGIFELPAFIIGEAAALSFGVMAIMALFKRERRNQLLSNLKQNLKYLAIALALLVPAAIIETYVTPLLLNNIV